MKKEENKKVEERIPERGRTQRNISTEMKESFIDYAMTVITDRALPDIRDGLKPGKIFYSKNKLIQVALGFSSETECADGIHILTGHMVGHCGLIVTNHSSSELGELLAAHEEPEFARAGAVAGWTVTLPEGYDSVSEFPHSMETQLRKLGLPTLLHDAKIRLLADHTVCKEGDVLSSSQAQLLKLMNIRMAKFEITAKAVWDKETQQVSEI